MACLEIAKKYFELSNHSDFDGLTLLLDAGIAYKSQNTGDYHGIDRVIEMQRSFHAKFKSLQWEIVKIEAVNENKVLFEYEFEGIQKNGVKLKTSGLEYITVVDKNITEIEIKNK